MAISLEATLVIPISLAAWIGLLAVFPHAYQEVSQAAGLEVSACRFSLENQHLYQSREINLFGGPATCQIIALQVSPQMIIEVCDLVRDDGRYVSQMTGGLSNSQASPAEAAP
jgi:hypothetical protein